MFFNGHVVDPPGYLKLALPRLGHTLFIDREHDHSRRVFFGQFKDPVCFFSTAFKMG